MRRMGVTTGDVQSSFRFTRHVRRVLLHAGKLIVPTISDGDTILPERVAPSSAISEKAPFSTRGTFEKTNGMTALYAHTALTSVLSRMRNSTPVSEPASRYSRTRHRSY